MDFDNAIFAKRLQDMRKEKGFSNEKLGKLIGTNSGSISRWENQKITPNIVFIFRLSKTLGVSADYLLGLTDY